MTSVFKINQVDPAEFVIAVWKLLNKVDHKKNVLILKGSSNSGKTLLAELITATLLTGRTAGLTGDHQFEFEDFLNRDVALVNELRLTPNNCNQCKLLFGGEPLPINRKNRQLAILNRIPTIVTTNTGIGEYLKPADTQAIFNRAYYFEFNNPINTTCYICPCQWEYFLEQWTPATTWDDGTRATTPEKE